LATSAGLVSIVLGIIEVVDVAAANVLGRLDVAPRSKVWIER
jgi:hypothetical protein